MCPVDCSDDGECDEWALLVSVVSGLPTHLFPLTSSHLHC